MKSNYDVTSPSYTEEEGTRKSEAAFGSMLVVCLFAVLCPGAPVQFTYGLMFLATGTLLVVLPPRVRLPASLCWLAAIMLMLALAAFLPASWFSAPGWRVKLESVGLNIGSQVVAHSQQALEQWVGLCVVVVVGMYLLGHRVSDKLHLLFAWGVSLVVAIYAGISIWASLEKLMPAWDVDPSFGFFPNRNHTATLLVLGTVASVGCIFQSVRLKRHGLAGVSALTFVIIQLALWGFCTSRAGALLGIGFVGIWLLGLGKRYISKKVFITVIVFAAIGLVLFMFSSGELKKRLNQTAESLTNSSGANASIPAQQATVEGSVPLDFRVLIYKDALRMTGDSPLTGTGLGSFRYVFPQYRHDSATAARSIHPESDWLQVASEQGWPSMLVLAGGVIWLWVLAFRSALKRPFWAMRWNGLVAAMVVPVHGMFDVPGHRVGLAWMGVLLLALTLRETGGSRMLGVLGRNVYRCFGVLAIVVGGYLLNAEFGTGPSTAIVEVGKLQARALALYEQDSAERSALPPGTAPVEIPSEEDKLEIAMGLLDQAIALAPLDSELHFYKGFIAMHFVDKQDIVEKEFAIERLLNPKWVQCPMRQAHEWAPIDPNKTETLWVDALTRADVMAELAKEGDWGRTEVHERMIYQAKGNDELMKRAFKYVKSDPLRFVTWATFAASATLDEAIPQLLAFPRLDLRTRDALLQIWKNRGDKVKAEAWKPE